MKKIFAIIMLFGIMTSTTLVKTEAKEPGTQDFSPCFILDYIVED